MNSTALSFLKSENNHAHAYAYDHHQSLYLDDQPLPPPGTSAWEQHQALFADGFGAPFCTSDLLQLPWHNTTHMPCLEFKDLEDICGEFGLWATDINKSFFEEDTNIVVVVDAKPLINAARESTLDQSEEKVDRSSVIGNKAVSWRSSQSLQSERSIKSSGLQLNEIRKYFDVPITKAAKELNVGLTVLKKRCRELSIMRWPHRKIKSLKSLINHAKELGLTDEIEMLEEHRRMLQKLPEMELTERTKKLRQACFKANYKKRRALAAALA